MAEVEAASARLVNILTTVTNYVTEANGAPCSATLAPGAVVDWGGCGQCESGACGMVYVRVEAMFRSFTFPEPTLEIGCGAPLALQLRVGVLRCLSVDSNGGLDDAESTEAALVALSDALAVRRALACMSGDVVLGIYEPLGPQGGCVGGEWQVTVDLDG